MIFIVFFAFFWGVSNLYIKILSLNVILLLNQPTYQNFYYQNFYFLNSKLNFLRLTSLNCSFIHKALVFLFSTFIRLESFSLTTFLSTTLSKIFLFITLLTILLSTTLLINFLSIILSTIFLYTTLSIISQFFFLVFYWVRRFFINWSS